MTNLLEKLQSIIGGWLEQAPQREEYPYITYRLESSQNIDESTREDFILVVDCWDRDSDGINLESLAKQVDDSLNRYKFIDDDVAIRIYRVSRGMIEDSDLEVRRRQLRYEVQAYFFD